MYSKWYYQFWAYSDIYVDEKYLLYIKEVQRIIQSGEFDLEKTYYLITHKPVFATDQDIIDRPTETEALWNLFHLSLTAEAKRLSDDTRRTVNLQTVT